MKKVYAFMGGRTLTFVWAMFSAGVTLSAFSKLTSEFVALASLLSGIIAARAAAQDRTPGKPSVDDSWSSENGVQKPLEKSE